MTLERLKVGAANIAIEKMKNNNISESQMGVSVVGCGLIGQRRAQVVHDSIHEQLVSVVDIDRDQANSVAQNFGCVPYSEWQDAIDHTETDILIVATPNKFLAPVSIAALKAGKHVLCEKPPGRHASETRQMVDAAEENNRVLKVGFNHRYHPAIWKAHQLFDDGAIGRLMFIRAVYGHGGRPGYDKEWRGSADLSGGGEMLDQGVHIVDLCRWFLGEFSEVYAASSTYFWQLGDFPNGKQLEDNAFAILKTSTGQVAQLHTSWTQWKNRFSFEIFGEDGFLRIEGLGGSYGTESLTYGRRRPESGPPILEEFEFSGKDMSWVDEWTDFMSAIRNQTQPLSNGEDGLNTMKVIAAFYQSAHSGTVIHL